MDLLEFECPLCNGLFNAAVTDTEVTCPHCDETICLGSKDSSSSANVTLVAQPITTPAPIFPPGYKKPAADDLSAPLGTVSDASPPVIIDDDVDESGSDTESTPAPPTVPEESLPVVIINGDVDESGGGAESTPAPTAVPEESQRVVIINDDVDETSVGHETDTAIENLLPPNFQLDDDQIETATDRQKIAEATVVIDVRVDAEPITVGRGINKRELRSRTPDEKSQFKRKKNVIIWGIGVLIIIVTMIVMLKLV